MRPIKGVSNKRHLIWLSVILIGFFVFKAFYSTKFPITGDEAYHWEWSRNPAFGYYDHPPMVGWLIAITGFIGHILGGADLFWTRLPGLLSITGVLIMTCLLIIQTTGGIRPSIYGLLFLAFTPLFSIGANLITTDHPLLFFSGLTVYLLYQALFLGDHRYWYYAGIAIGCAFLSKFISILLIPGLLLFLILSAEHRSWFKRKEPYLFALIGGLIYMPNLIWNARHNWITFLFNLTRQPGTTISLKDFGLLIIGQMGLIGPVLFPLLIIALFYGLQKGIKEGDRKVLFFSLMSLSVFGFFALIGLFGEVGAHWPAIGYLPGVVTLFYLYHHLLEHLNLKSVIWWSIHVGLVFSLILTIGLHLFLVYNYLLPEEMSIAGKRVEIDHSILGFFYGWKEVGEYINRLQIDYGEQLFLITPHYAISGMISFNTPGQPFVRLFGQRYTTGLNYKYWNNFSELKGRDALFIYDDQDDNNLDKLNNSFQRVNKLEPLKIYNPVGRHVRTFYFFYCERFDGRDLTVTASKVSSWFR